MSDVETPSAPDALPEDLFLRDIGNIFDRELACLLEPFLVPDVPCEDANWDIIRKVLLVESPHVSEIEAGYPLAGCDDKEGGMGVTRLLQDHLPNAGIPSCPIGKLVSTGHDRVSCLGILNVCRLPFQAKAYKKQCREFALLENHARWNELRKAFKKIKKYPFVVIRENSVQKSIDHAIVRDLKRRLQKIHHLDSEGLACCGEFSLAFYAKTQVAYLRHPSHRFWEKDDSKDAAKKFFRDESLGTESEPDSAS